MMHAKDNQFGRGQRCRELTLTAAISILLSVSISVTLFLILSPEAGIQRLMSANCEILRRKKCFEKVVSDEVDMKIQMLQLRYTDGVRLGNSTVLPPNGVECAASVTLRNLPTVDEVSEPQYWYTVIRGWDDSGDAAFIRRCFTYNQTTGHFIVWQPGVYFIHSRLSFLGSPESVVRTYGQKIVRQGAAVGQIELVADKQVVNVTNQLRGSAPVVASSATGVFLLQQEDRLHVEARPADKLHRGPETLSYFAIFKVAAGGSFRLADGA